MLMARFASVAGLNFRARRCTNEDSKKAKAPRTEFTLRDFLEIPYEQLEELNLESQAEARSTGCRPTASRKSG